MQHYPIEAWIDYVRGCGSEESRDQMTRHVSECAACRRLVDHVSTLQSTLIADRDHPVPDEVVEAAVRLFRPPDRHRGRPNRRNSN